MKNTNLLIALMLALAGMSTACSKSASVEHEYTAVSASNSYPEKGNFRLSLTDAPHKSLSHVFVTVDHVELLLEKGGRQGRLIVGENLGTIDLLKLRDGVHLPIKDLDLAEQVVVKEFRLILKEEDHWIVRKDDSSVCHLKTPSQQKTGLKLKMPNGGIAIEDGSIYSLIVDFDVDHSIVDNKKNCLLKPVLKVKSLTQVPDDSENPENPEDPSSGGGDNSGGVPTDGNSGGSDGGGSSGDDGGSSGGENPGDGSTGGDGSSGGETPGDTSGEGSGSDGDTSIGGDTSTGGETSGGDTSSGETSGGDTSSGEDTSTGNDSSSGGETGTDDGSNDGAGDPGDGAPVIIDGDPMFFNS